MNSFLEFVNSLGLMQINSQERTPITNFSAQSDISFVQTHEPDLLYPSKLQTINNQIGLVYGESASLQRMLNLSTFVGLQCELLVIDGGNRFDLHFVAYAIRRFTPDWETVAEKIKIVRTFTCYEMVKALELVPNTPAPLLVIDLLATFYDENIKDAESYRLASKCVEQLLRLKTSKPIVVSLPLANKDGDNRVGLSSLIENVADHIYSEKLVSNPTVQLDLF